MKRHRYALLTVLSLVAATVTVASPATAAAVDIAVQLAGVPGLTVVEEQPTAAPYRFFVLTITQAADHRRPGAGTFQQRLTLLHRGTDRPTVLHTTGYGVPDYVFRSEPTRLIDGNQISVEQRFFTPSRPAPANWSDLTVWQAATDHHRIVAALKAVYPLHWISTGASKGGMTSIYHRRFYPADVQGTVAYVAPQDVVNREDSAYDEFFTTAGDDPACRKALDGVQVEGLKRRATLVAKYRAWATENERTFGIVGGVDRAFEFMVGGTTWAFWQFSGQADCARVPPATATDEQILAWIDAVFGLDSNTDQGITPYLPYYYQAATQLGYPYVKLPHLAKLQKYRGQDVAKAYVPRELAPRFKPLAMADVDHWVRQSGRQLLFVYGGNDPWGAEPFRLGRGTKDSLTYTAPNANHGADIGLLTAAETATATAAVRRWAGLHTEAAQPAGTAAAPDPVLDRDPALDRRYNR